MQRFQGGCLEDHLLGVMDDASRRARFVVGRRPTEGETIVDSWVWILIGVAYLTLFFWLGLATLRNGHGWLFFFGIFFPILWIFGAFAKPTEAR